MSLISKLKKISRTCGQRQVLLGAYGNLIIPCWFGTQKLFSFCSGVSLDLEEPALEKAEGIRISIIGEENHHPVFRNYGKMLRWWLKLGKFVINLVHVDTLVDLPELGAWFARNCSILLSSLTPSFSLATCLLYAFSALAILRFCVCKERKIRNPVIKYYYRIFWFFKR